MVPAGFGVGAVHHPANWSNTHKGLVFRCANANAGACHNCYERSDIETMFISTEPEKRRGPMKQRCGVCVCVSVGDTQRLMAINSGRKFRPWG